MLRIKMSDFQLHQKDMNFEIKKKKSKRRIFFGLANILKEILLKKFMLGGKI